MKLQLTRDSVAMGDDADAPHEEERDVAADLTIRAAIEAVLADRYLASIHGGRATWAAQAEGGTPLAVVAQQWGQQARLLTAGQGGLATLAGADGSVRLHFAYYTQRDPDAVYRELSEHGRAPRR
ncbi:MULTISPECIES: hypothetical protein [unclassified Kitasatospora]|uniref:hypothetical protein n=1 Tax=unclassified Kitasatospora TaxID=2633591 RepID=UPI00070EE240|nr:MULTISPECIES: hypothetical protein [unclassified Kitasatospora]KQV14837.1 hypothetical protein ASC99_30310 [Kitasatospora sp. Root107]KRB68192.1 hypothetical protein ASE03_30095 [Kitasatospora sp. Root187]